MANSVTYILKGYGRIDSGWVKDCFGLFREQDVNIRKLLLLKNGHPDCFSMLEVHFVLPESIPSGANESLSSVSGEANGAFLGLLAAKLGKLDGLEHSLTLGG
jgi:hypothetical protein